MFRIQRWLRFHFFFFWTENGNKEMDTTSPEMPFYKKEHYVKAFKVGRLTQQVFLLSLVWSGPPHSDVAVIDVQIFETFCRAETRKVNFQAALSFSMGGKNLSHEGLYCLSCHPRDLSKRQNGHPRRPCKKRPVQRTLFLP